nr:MAG TPA: hypothetical protein [Caudoviricetes sp.]
MGTLGCNRIRLDLIQANCTENLWGLIHTYS